ncbi:MAG: thiamine pyrophosphate-dependent enzyme, partial [Chloroflexota bacterium]|nr:thiamine pyrophosphate-dependent enzyme [Chloroflexota bacterium]
MKVISTARADRAGAGLADRDELLADYRLAVRSREASILGRKEVLAGRAPFGIFGDGKEIAQLALARVCQPGDWRAGYYRDQTWAFATGMSTLGQFFSQLYTDSTIEADPASAGRQMSSHFSTRILDDAGQWKAAIAQMNSSSDLTAVASQMPRLLGLAYASKLYRQRPALARAASGHSIDGNEVAFGSIGNASTSEGLFWETMNAAGVLQVPMVVSVWDDGFGISVPNELQTVKSSISRALAGFKPTERSSGVAIYEVAASDYPALRSTYARAAINARTSHVPALVHVTGMTQPLGHSSSGSHERYKSAERLRFEIEGDAIVAFRNWLIDRGAATASMLDAIAEEERGTVREAASDAWEHLQQPIRSERDELLRRLEAVRDEDADAEIPDLIDALARSGEVSRKVVAGIAQRALFVCRDDPGTAASAVRDFARCYVEDQRKRYRANLYSASVDSPMRIGPVAA